MIELRSEKYHPATLRLVCTVEAKKDFWLVRAREVGCYGGHAEAGTGSSPYRWLFWPTTLLGVQKAKSKGWSSKTRGSNLLVGTLETQAQLLPGSDVEEIEYE